MSDPLSFILVCPQCRRKFRGDPAQPNARYRCPDDRTQLVAEASLNETMGLATAKKMTLDGDPGGVTVPGADTEPSQAQGGGRSLGGQSMAAEARRSVVASMQLGPAAGGAGGMEPGAQKYEITGKLGQGGMGQVLKVLDRDLKREVAMKLLLTPDGRGVAPETLVRFVEEAQATGQLEHPNIVPVHDLGVDGEGRIYFTLKYVQGDSLKKVLKGRHEDLPMDETNPAAGTYRTLYSPQRMINILIDICQGVAYAHAKGVIHRDLKPDNVMLGKFGEVLVMDWGLAKVVGREGAHDHAQDSLVTTSRSEDESAQTVEGAVAGTPAYMAPEQARGEVQALDARTDIYSLGALLYEFLTGHPPYRGPGALAVVEMVKAGPPPAPGKGGPGFEPIPRELKAVCLKAMAREPGDRYQSALALRDDLQAWLENREVAAAPDTALQRFGKWTRRNRRMIAVAATSALVVIGVAGGLWFGQREKKIHDLLADADYQMNTATGIYQAGARGSATVKADDPYAAQKLRSSGAERIKLYRDGLARVIDDLRKVLELAPRRADARARLAAANMELWRLALAEKNLALMQSTRAEVERYAGIDSQYADELNGWGSLQLALSPADAEAYLFSFEPYAGLDRSGEAQSPRLVPVPFNLKELKADRRRLLEMQKRESSGEGLPPGAVSIFDLATPSESRLGSGHVAAGRLPPGSYLLLLRAGGAEGRVEIRVPVNIGRGEKVERSYAVPSAGAIPPGFVYIAGGGAAPVGAVGGSANAGAPSPHDMSVFDALIAREEVTMGEYAEYLKALAKKNPAEARKHYPHDFGPDNSPKFLAELKGGELAPLLPDPNFLKSSARGVTLEEARAYIAWRSAKDNLPYRLPKDWEWEIACRGADGRNFSWGNEPGAGFAIVTQGYGGQSGGMSWRWKDYKDESPWGAHNLAGGAAEWTGSYFKADAAESDPVYHQFAIRGNAWALPPVGLMCNFRTSGQPDYFHPTIGFRLALDYPAQPGVATVQSLSEPQNEHNHAHQN